MLCNTTVPCYLYYSKKRLGHDNITVKEEFEDVIKQHKWSFNPQWGPQRFKKSHHPLAVIVSVQRDGVSPDMHDFCRLRVAIVIYSLIQLFEHCCTINGSGMEYGTL